MFTDETQWKRYNNLPPYHLLIVLKCQLLLTFLKKSGKHSKPFNSCMTSKNSSRKDYFSMEMQQWTKIPLNDAAK